MVSSTFQKHPKALRPETTKRRRLNIRGDSYAYQDANYGYDGFYEDQDAYNYYFREGFRRGYEDGYYDRYQYGVYSNGEYNVLGAVLSEVLNLVALR